MQFQRTFDEKEMRSSLSCQSACPPGPSRRALRQAQGAYESVVVRIRLGRRGDMAEATKAVSNEFGTVQSRCDLLRSLHLPSRPLLLPNAWDAATARAVVTAGFPVVATTSAGITAALGYQDRVRPPSRIWRSWVWRALAGRARSTGERWSGWPARLPRLQRRRVKQGCLCARSAELNDLAECAAARTSLWWDEPLSP